jgi:hypothetical protein
MALSNKEHQALLRKRRAASSLFEVRGIYLSAEDGKKLKAYAKSLASASANSASANIAT